MNIAIIGAGLAGLSSAITLATAGKKVTVYESAKKVGGKLSEMRLGHYRFDLGPSLFTMPHWIDELYTGAGKNPNDYYSYKKLDIITHYFYEDGTAFCSMADPQKFRAELERNGIDARNLSPYLDKAAEIYNTVERIFLLSSIHKVSSYLNWDVLSSVFKLPFIKSFERMHEMNSKYFRDSRLQQYFNRMATYNGSDPYQAPGTLNLISHIEHNHGAFFPYGGMYSIAEGLYRLALDLGVHFEFDTMVDEIILEDKEAKGIMIYGKFIPYDVVVSNMDIFYTYKKLLPKAKHPQRILDQEKSSSALIFYWGIKKQFEQLGLHNIFFARDYKQEFGALFERFVPHDDPTVYINISSKECKSDAPEGSENWFVMINVPNDTGQDWECIMKKARYDIIRKINSRLGVDLETLIEEEEVLDPRTIESRTFSYKGSLYGNASNNKMAAFFRHANFSSSIRNLYFCGGSVHPGGGIPLAVQSGKIVGNLIIKG